MCTGMYMTWVCALCVYTYGIYTMYITHVNKQINDISSTSYIHIDMSLSYNIYMHCDI